ncbi:hypothetical protein FRB94_006035 [Tulasnella sp. JGI-2019a]|nr:hypothetical protein FRB94_006035 [Tulasnella sp. JGI-2019a]
MIRHDTHEPMGLMQFLAEPTIVDGVAEWPLPRLRHLSIMNSNVDRGEFVGAISNRYGKVKGESNDGVGVCAPLRLLIEDTSTRCLKLEDVEEIRRVLGDSNFSYNI